MPLSMRVSGAAQRGIAVCEVELAVGDDDKRQWMDGEDKKVKKVKWEEEVACVTLRHRKQYNKNLFVNKTFHSYYINCHATTV